MRRRHLLALAWLARPARAATREELLQTVADLATALSAGDAAAFLARFEESMEGYAALRENVSALTAQADLTSSVELVRHEGDSGEFDWYLEIRLKLDAGVSARRRQRVKLRLRGSKIEAFSPVELFAPLKL